MLPDLPIRDYGWRHDVRNRAVRNSHSARTLSTRRVHLAEYFIVGLLDATLVVALLHPVLLHSVLKLAH